MKKRSIDSAEKSGEQKTFSPETSADLKYLELPEGADMIKYIHDFKMRKLQDDMDKDEVEEFGEDKRTFGTTRQLRRVSGEEEDPLAELR